MICFFDTETTGVPQKKPGPLHLEPHVIQLAISLYDKDRRPVYEISVLVKPPEGVTIPEEATAIHGITPQDAIEYGVTKVQALALFRYACERATRVVAHNAAFDKKLLGFEATRCDVPFPSPPEKLFCTMEATSNICRIPPTPAMIKWNMGGEFKSPKLSEAYEHLFGEKLIGAHDALIDTRACARVYFELCDKYPEKV